MCGISNNHSITLSSQKGHVLTEWTWK